MNHTQRLCSIEFFPPKTAEGAANLRATRARLASLSPAYFSVTFGAGGSTQSGTMNTVLEIRQEGHEVAPHLSCQGTSAAQIVDMLGQYRHAGVKRLVVLRGDQPSGTSADVTTDSGLRYACDLVELIRKETGDWFDIAVAAYPEMHPQAKSPKDDLDNFVRKVKAGADEAITQYFFNADAYFRFVDAAAKAGVDIPIVPGIMPIMNFTQLARFSDLCGAEIPRWIRLRLAGYGDDLASIREFGLEVVSQLCDRLLAGGAPGLHIYSLNQADPVLALMGRLKSSSLVQPVLPTAMDYSKLDASLREHGEQTCIAT